jgi:AcrR family transcriptional regulator
MRKVTPEQIAQKRDEIINACEQLYQTMSFREITLKEIGTITSFSRPTIYNYFQTKEEIFLALFQREYDRWNEDLTAILNENAKLTKAELSEKIAASLAGRDQLLKLLEQATDLDNIIILQSRLTDVRYQIESAESRIRVLENQVEYGTLNLSITEVLEDTVIEEPHIVTYGERVMDQFNDMWEGTVEFFQDFLLGLIAAIPFLVFMGIVAAVIIIIVFSVRKKRRKREAKALEEAKAEAAKREALKEKKEESKKDQE